MNTNYVPGISYTLSRLILTLYNNPTKDILYPHCLDKETKAQRN